MADAQTRPHDQDHRIWHVHQVGSGILGGVLVTFGVLGFVDRLSLFSTEGGEVAGFPTNGLLSTISVVFGVVLIASAFAPRSTSSTVATVVGAAFVLAGFANLLVLETSANVLSFELPNVIFALLSGLALLVLGLYGRGSRALDEDNPYRLKAEASAAAKREAAARREAARSVRVREQAQKRAERRSRGRR
jgi:signal transduction histidine kinase